MREDERLPNLALVTVPFVLGGLTIIAGLWLVAGGTFGTVGRERAIDLLFLGLLLVCAPYGLWAGRRTERQRRLEDRFPDFVRDLATNHRAGVPLATAITIAADGDYGLLGPEIRRMRDQLSWALPLEDVLARFARRVRTHLVRRTITLIIQANRSGGNTADVLMAAARDARELQTLDHTRRNGMGTYTAVVYVTFIVFVAVLALLFRVFVPSIVEAAGAVSFADRPPLLTQLSAPTLENYRNFYLAAVAVQAAGSGILAALLQTGSPGAGLRHTSWMLLVGYAVFAAL